MTSLFFKLAEQSPLVAILTAILLTVVWFMLRLWDRRQDERHQELLRSFVLITQMTNAILRIVTVNTCYQTGAHPDIDLFDGDDAAKERGMRYLSEINSTLKEIEHVLQEIKRTY
jgi:hypothetical protein